MEFVQVATIHVLLCFHNLYAYAKAKSGPLKPGVESVEGTVKNVVGPVYDKYHGLPIGLLKFIDRKVSPLCVEFGWFFYLIACFMDLFYMHVCKVPEFEVTVPYKQGLINV